jgi:hypothetical protein
MDKEGKMGKVTAEEMQGLMYGNSNNTARSGGSSPKKVSASDMENLMAPYRSQEIKHTVFSPGTQPARAASAGASSRKQSDIMKEQLDAIKAQRDDAAIKAGAYRRAGNLTEQAKEQQEAANKAAIEYENAYTQWKNQRNAEAVEDYNPDENKFKAVDAVLSGVQNAFQSMGQYAAAASSYLSGNPEAQAWEAKRLMESGVSGTEAVKRAGLADKREIPITDYKTQAELRHEKNVASVGAFEGGALQLVNTISNMVPSLVANAVLPGSGLPMMAASAAGNKYVDAYEKYGNTDMAFALGSAAGAASMLTEQLGGVYGKMGGTKLGQAVSKKLMSEAPGLYSVANSVGGKWLRDAISEGVEEGAEDIVNYAIEKSLTGESDEMDNFGYDMLLGALAGGVLGGGNAAMRSVTYNRLGKALNASPAAVAQQVQEGMEKGAGTAPAIYAAEVQKNPSNQMVGRLYEANLTYDAESGLSKIQNDITQVSINEIKAMVSKADALAQAAQKLNVEATPQAVATAITDVQRTQSIKTAEDSVEQAFAPAVDNPANAGEKAYNSALAGVAANQGVAARINNDPAARQAFSQLTGVQFTGNSAQNIAAIEVATQNIAKSGKQAISQAEYAQRVAAAGEQAAAQFDADMQAQAEQMQQESLDRWLSVEQNTITDVDGKRRIKEITNTDVRGNTEIGYKKAEILGSKKKAVAEVNNAAKYLGKTIVWFEGAVQVNGQYRLTNGYRAPDGTIYVNINSRDPLMVTFGHEMFHDLVADSKYSGLIDTLVENPDYADMVKGMMNAKTELYERNGIELDPNAAAEEVAADISGDLLGSRDMLEYIGARNTEAATGIKGFLNRILKKLKGKPSAQEAYNRLSEAQRALLDGMEGKAETGVNGSESFSLIDVAPNGVEIYETSLATQQLSESQKKKQYLALIKNQYRGRTARLERNGHVVYVRPDIQEAGKPIYGDRRSTANGAKALRNSLADGDVFDLLENAEYDRSSRDTKNHKNADYFDYYVKTVQIDGKVYDLVADVKRAYGNSDGLYYTLHLVDNATKKAVVSQRPQTIGSSEPITASEMGSNSFSADMVPQSDTAVNNYSMQNSAEDASGKHSLIDIPAMDSTGRELSAEQREYFLGSKVVDTEGRLKPVYHGSPAVFTEFSPDFMSQHGSSEGQGFYFTDYKPMAEGYQKDGGQLLEGYLDIKKPLSDSEITLTRAEVKKLLQAVDPTGDEVLVNYDPAGGIGYPSKAWYNRALDATVKAAMDYSSSDSEILAEIANGGAGVGAVLEAARNTLGYDGYIVDGKYDNATVYVAFDSSQFKNIDNTSPTESKDIRYSLMDIPAMDNEYSAAVESGNMQEAQRLVDEAAKAAGYNSKPLYHGTHGFGFTKIDVSNSDDKMSFFATSNPDMAQTYSGKKGNKAINNAAGNTRAMPIEDVVNRLNEEASNDGYEVGSSYRIMKRADVKSFLADLDRRIESLNDVIARKVDEYADRLAEDFSQNNITAHDTLVRLLEATENYRYSGMSTPLWMLSKHTDVFSESEKKLAGEIEADVRLRNRLEARGGSDDVVVREDLDRYSISVMSFAEAREELAKLSASWNYSLRGRTDNFLDVDGNNHNWNEIFTTLEPKGGNNFLAEYNQDTGSVIMSDKDGRFAEVHASTLSDALPGMARAITKKFGSYFAPQILSSAKDQLRNGATAEVAVKSTGKMSTRDIAKFAKEQGYRGVKISNIYDNGGGGKDAGAGDVYIFFYPEEDVKSADPVTYDDAGNVIPLSERFNNSNSDIRYSLMEDAQYMADIDRVVSEATEKANDELKAAQAEVKNIRQQLADYRQRATAEAKMNDRWRDAETKLLTEIAAAKEREKAANARAEFMAKYDALAKQYRADLRANNQQAQEKYNEKLTEAKDEFNRRRTQDRIDRVVREDRAKSKARLRTAEQKSTTTEDVAKVLTEIPKKDKETFKAKIAESWRSFKRQWINTKDELERFGNEVGDSRIMYAANNVGQASAAAQYSIGGAGQYDLNGKKIGDKNLMRVFEPAKKAGLTDEFYTYLLHEHNVDRMSLRENAQRQLAELRAKLNREVNGFAEMTDENISAAAGKDTALTKAYTEAQIAAAKQYKRFQAWAEKQFDKPVFGSSVTADDSRAAAADLLDAHPEFEKWAKDVYAYLDGLMEVRKQGGLVSADMAQYMKELYPHYVPTYRDMPSTSGGYSNPNSVAVNSTIKSAKGGNQDIMPLIDSIARQTLQTFSAAKKNILGNMLYEDAMDTTRDISEYIQSVTEEGDLVDLDADSAENLKNTLRIWVDGKPVTLHMSEAMADGFRPIEQSNSFGMKALRSINSTFKKLVTQWNPVFIVRNFVRDAQSALYFTHYSNATFIKNYGKAVKEIATNGKYWQLYQAMGGKGTTYYDPKTGLSDRHHFKNGAVDKVAGGLNRVIDILSFANEAVEQYPRLAEFISTMEDTGDVQQALYNAADITTNFGRGGFAARKLNASLVPFFNPGMQGLSKNIRNVIDRRGWKEIGQLISRLLINGVAPGIIMGLLYDGLKEDDDYKELSNYIKDSNILIKIGDNKFIKVPMGREPSVITAFTNRMWRWLKGEPASSAFAGYPSFAIEQLAPNNPLSNNIFAGITAMSTNKNWYGGDIVSSYMEEKPDYLQYDESTDAFSIWLGEITRHGKNGIEGLSPKKVNYLIDQYSGFIGDWLLPALSKKADVPAVVKAFVVDSVRQNRLGSDFYDALDEAKQVKETEFATAADDATYSYLYKQSKAASEITKQLKEIYNSGEKTRKEKMSEARDLLELRNEIYRKALLTVGTYEETAKSIGSADSDVVKREANRKAFGAEYALKNYNKDVGEKAAEYVAQGVTYDQYYAAYFAARGIVGDKGDNGKTISGSASRKKKAAIDKAVPGASTKQKHLLYEALGVSEKVW